MSGPANATVLVGVREFRQRVRSRGFLLTTLAIPLLMVVVWLVIGSSAFGEDTEPPLQSLTRGETGDLTIGLVDDTGLIDHIPDEVPAGMFKSYPDESAAGLALDSGDVDAFYIVLEDYRETGSIRRVSRTLPIATPDMELVDWILMRNLFPDKPVEELARLRWPLQNGGLGFVSLAADSNSGTSSSNPMLPFVAAMAVMIPLFTSGGYLLQSLAEEKSSRVMELLLLSLRPRQLLTGKLLGLGGLTLIQYLTWAAVTGVAIAVTGRDPGQLLGELHLSISEIALVVPYALGAFTVYAAMMAGIGALSPDTQSSRAWVFLISLPMLIPVYVWSAILSAPNGVLAIVLSIFPFSAPTAMLMRLTGTTVPTWQIAASLTLLLATAVGMVLLMARLFRVQTLLSGEAISLHRIWSTFRS